jgi:TonB family protein
MKVRITFVALLSLTLVRSALADDSVQQAKQLYDAAEYDSVLSVTRDLDSAAAGGLSLELREYRALSLLALSRTSEAEQEIALMFTADPMYVAPATAAPRWKTAVDRVRTRVRPGIVRSRYAAAKQRYDAKDFTRAATEFEALKVLLASAQKEGMTGLDDLVTLTDGFLQLSRTSLTPSTPAPVVAEPPPPARTAVATRTPVVTPPVAVERGFPRWDPPAFVNVRQEYDGRIGVMVGADGTVKSVRILDSIHATYDSVLTAAAKKWRFEPATRDGEAIAYEVEIPVVLTPTPSSARPR